MTSKTPFWHEGLRFECQGSGQCCVSRGDYGYVYLTLKDRKLLAKHHKISTSEFTKRYCEKTDGYWHLTNPKAACQFLKVKRCTVYKSRPTQCRTWPFWPENMKAKVWQNDIAVNCPGVGQGRLYSKKEIQELLKKDPVA